MNHKEAPQSRREMDRYLHSDIREVIERDYYDRVSEQAQFDVVVTQPDFVKNPLQHVAIYSDHGPVHARDVAKNIVDVLEAVDGILIPRRSAGSLEFMKGYGVLAAYCHDIGMKDFSAFGRAMHPEYAAQEVFRDHWNPIIDDVWSQNCGNIAWRLLNAFSNTELAESPKVILREMLALSMAHSKTKVPITLLNNASELRKTLKTVLTTNLRHLYHQQIIAKHLRMDQLRREGGATSPAMSSDDAPHRAHLAYDEFRARNPNVSAKISEISDLYEDFDRNAFAWLISDASEIRTLAADIIDTLRALRVADALRQRGTALKTSASYPILVDHSTGNAVFVLQKASGDTFLLESPQIISAGEANIASTEITAESDLRVSFHRGAFANRDAAQRSARNVAIVIEDIQRDVIDSFLCNTEDQRGLKSATEIRILIEATDDNIEFADIVLEELNAIDSGLRNRSRLVPSLRNVDVDERRRYLEAESLEWSMERRRQILNRVAQAGHRTDKINSELAFVDVRITKLREGEVLLNAGAAPGFVYLPMEEGLRAMPLGGYRSFEVRPWIPLGNIRAIRGAPQEATVVTDADVAVVMIPRETYLKYWHHTYSEIEFCDMIPALVGADDHRGTDHILEILTQISMLDSQVDDQEIAFLAKFGESHGLSVSTDDLKARVDKNGKADLLQLRNSVVAYLSVAPSHFQVARLRDLLNTAARLDNKISSEEILALQELNGLLSHAIDDDDNEPQFTILLVPQNMEQDLAISSLFPLFQKRETAGGTAFTAGSYYSREYANIVCGRYRDLHFFTVVVEETHHARSTQSGWLPGTTVNEYE